MYLLGHLAAGLIIGTILFWYFRDPILIAACAVGSILPDLIDKPLGQIVFALTIGYGRIFAHTLSFSLIMLLIGILIWWYFKSFAGIAFFLGVLSHQLLDSMWLEPVNWFYPFLGHFTRPAWINEDNINLTLISLKDITNPSEWLFALAIILILVQIVHFGSDFRFKRPFLAIFYVMSGLLILGGIMMLFCGEAGIFCFLTGWKVPLDNIFAGALLIGIVLMAMMTHYIEKKER
jgi:membrane-bound metal-dependent hydrolase YbcI (DUF457 family)